MGDSGLEISDGQAAAFAQIKRYSDVGPALQAICVFVWIIIVIEAFLHAQDIPVRAACVHACAPGFEVRRQGQHCSAPFARGEDDHQNSCQWDQTNGCPQPAPHWLVHARADMPYRCRDQPGLRWHSLSCRYRG